SRHDKSWPEIQFLLRQVIKIPQHGLLQEALIRRRWHLGRLSSCGCVPDTLRPRASRLKAWYFRVTPEANTDSFLLFVWLRACVCLSQGFLYRRITGKSAECDHVVVEKPDVIPWRSPTNGR